MCGSVTGNARHNATAITTVSPAATRYGARQSSHPPNVRASSIPPIDPASIVPLAAPGSRVPPSLRPSAR